MANEESGIGVRIWMEVDCKKGYEEIETKREFKLYRNNLETEEELKRQLRKYISEVVEQPHFFTQPFSYTTHYHQGSVSRLGSAIPGMIGGLAVGVLGTILVADMMEDVELEDAYDVLDGGVDPFFGGEND